MVYEVFWWHPRIQKSLWHFPLSLYFLEAPGGACKMHPRSRNPYLAVGPRNLHSPADSSAQWRVRTSDWATVIKPRSVELLLSLLCLGPLRPRRSQACLSLSQEGPSWQRPQGLSLAARHCLCGWQCLSLWFSLLTLCSHKLCSQAAWGPSPCCPFLPSIVAPGPFPVLSRFLMPHLILPVGRSHQLCHDPVPNSASETFFRTILSILVTWCTWIPPPLSMCFFSCYFVCR